MRHRLPLLLAVPALAVAGCGSGDDGASTATTPRATTPPRQTPSAPQGSAPGTPSPQEQLGLPATVPLDATGPAPAGSAVVIRRWSAALKRGDVEGAADLFAQPSLAANGPPVVRLTSRRARIAFNSLACGSVPTQIRGAQGYAVVTFRLTNRPGGSCGQAVGADARCAIKVRDGRITEWYRLPSAPPQGGSPAPEPQTPSRDDSPNIAV